MHHNSEGILLLNRPGESGHSANVLRLQRRLHVARSALAAAVPVTFIAFDLLWQAGRSLLRSPYAQRRALLDGLGLAAEHLSVPPAFPGQARALTDASRDLGLEGVILKRLASPYQPGQRSGDWLKIRHLAAATSSSAAGSPAPEPALPSQGQSWPACPAPPGWTTSARSAPGFAEAELRDLTARLLALEQPDSPFAAPVPADIARRTRWTRPALAAEVTYAEITPAGRMRHPVWRGLRPREQGREHLCLCMSARTDGQGRARGFHGCEGPPSSATVDVRTNP